MAQHILRFTGRTAVPEADLATIRARGDVKVLDHSGRTVLLEATEAAARGLAGDLTGWVVDPPRLYAVPDTKQSIKS